jgi:hypothetical protein
VVFSDDENMPGYIDPDIHLPLSTSPPRDFRFVSAPVRVMLVPAENQERIGGDIGAFGTVTEVGVRTCKVSWDSGGPGEWRSAGKGGIFELAPVKDEFLLGGGDSKRYPAKGMRVSPSKFAVASGHPIVGQSRDRAGTVVKVFLDDGTEIEPEPSKEDLERKRAAEVKEKIAQLQQAKMMAMRAIEGSQGSKRRSSFMGSFVGGLSIGVKGRGMSKKESGDVSRGDSMDQIGSSVTFDRTAGSSSDMGSRLLKGGREEAEWVMGAVETSQIKAKTRKSSIMSGLGNFSASVANMFNVVSLDEDSSKKQGEEEVGGNDATKSMDSVESMKETKAKRLSRRAMLGGGEHESRRDSFVGAIYAIKELAKVRLFPR